MVLGGKQRQLTQSVWKEIRKDWATLFVNSRFLIRDGSRVRFWKDFWCGEEALCRAYPNLLNSVVHKDVLDNFGERGV